MFRKSSTNIVEENIEGEIPPLPSTPQT